MIRKGDAGMKSQQAQLHGSIESAAALIKNLTHATPREGDTEKLKAAKDCDSLLQSLVGTYAIVAVLSNLIALTGEKQGDDLRTMLASVLLSFCKKDSQSLPQEDVEAEAKRVLGAQGWNTENLEKAVSGVGQSSGRWKATTIKQNAKGKDGGEAED